MVMAAKKQFKSTLERAKRIKVLTERHYEPGNNAKCYKSVWRRYVYPVYPMCYRTYLNYLSIPLDRQEPVARQLTFIDDLFNL